MDFNLVLPPRTRNWQTPISKTAGTHTINVGHGVDELHIRLWSGGGAGASMTGPKGLNTSGGGSGGYCGAFIPVKYGDKVEIIVGGSAGASYIKRIRDNVTKTLVTITPGSGGRTAGTLTTVGGGAGGVATVNDTDIVIKALKLTGNTGGSCPGGNAPKSGGSGGNSVGAIFGTALQEGEEQYKPYTGGAGGAGGSPSGWNCSEGGAGGGGGAGYFSGSAGRHGNGCNSSGGAGGAGYAIIEYRAIGSDSISIS